MYTLGKFVTCILHTVPSLCSQGVPGLCNSSVLRTLQGTQAQAQAVVDGAAQLMGAEPAVALEDVLRTTAGESLLPAAPITPS